MAKQLSKADIERIRLRKGAQRRSAVPADVLEALNRGMVPTANLVEWLTIDTGRLLENVLKEIGHAGLSAEIRKSVREICELGVTRRQEAIGKLLHETLVRTAERKKLFAQFSKHDSDIVRIWANYMLRADERIELADRLARTRPFAADPHFGVRECAWFTIRPYVISELDAGLQLLAPWVHDADANIRRCAVEGTRPRGVWCEQIPALKSEPEKALHLLEPVRSDPSKYVQLSVANWLNDASKSRPDWVEEICARWQVESPTPATQAIIKRGLRTLRGRHAPA